MTTTTPSRRFVVIDEAGIWSQMRRTHAYAPRGERAVSIEQFQPEIRQTVLAGLTLDGIVAPLILDGPMTGKSFLSWLEQELLPVLQPGDILVLD